MPDLPPRPVLEGTVDIDADLWEKYESAKDGREMFEKVLREREALIREQAGNARYLTVNGQRVAVRIIQDAAGVSFRKDFYRKIGTSDG
ncbi:MAG TPA: hypothetical protein VM782_12305 [Stellaceae bacterium]|nr:hypothetical protein [Stellaceae bacterium]